MTKLFAVGFPRELDEMQLAQLFDPHGGIETLTILRDQASGKSKACAFIQMKTESGAREAIAALNGKMFGDRNMEVRVALEKPAAPARNINQRLPAGLPQANPPEKKKRPRINR